MDNERREGRDDSNVVVDFYAGAGCIATFAAVTAVVIIAVVVMQWSANVILVMSYRGFLACNVKNNFTDHLFGGNRAEGGLRGTR
ncbi:hypothetical protein EDC56_0914 [Sinobacterium caligoides]|uniref:Uncharacterized protein n=1 Tax=Sinobacterium caligoides TaxID=933926 RepID=A0A3N2DZX6_9GAMM|nr:hypothetical protein EDC56_0914 [Sinobacterium caligoides]